MRKLSKNSGWIVSEIKKDLRDLYQKMKDKIIECGEYKSTDFQLIDSLINEFEAVAECEKLTSQLEAINRNCISLSLHESRMRVIEDKLEACKKENEELKKLLQAMTELAAENDSDAGDAQLKLAEAIKERDDLRKQLNRLCEVKDETVKDCIHNHNMFLQEKNQLAEAIKALEFYGDMDSYREIETPDGKRIPVFYKDMMGKLARQTIEKLKGDK